MWHPVFVNETISQGESSQFFEQLSQNVNAYAVEIGAAAITVDIWFLAFLRMLSRFGYFSFGPISIDVNLIEGIVAANAPRPPAGAIGRPPMGDDVVRFSHRLMAEVRRSGRNRVDELHVLLALMRTQEGLAGRVFSELGVTPEQVEEYARNQAQDATLQKLYTPEEAAEYLNVHVQTVRSWIRSGRLRARRLAGQRALRITATDLQSVLEPLDPGDFQSISAQ
jgi:excisionase family DNA binding protein